LSPSPSPKPPKPFRSYSELVDLLSARGMDVGPDPQRAARKLSQIGYYRLSGFWYPCREIEIDSQGEAVLDTQTGKPRRLDAFMPGTSLQGILDLYLYDKRLRLAVLDAIERIEVHIRTVIAHELGRLDPSRTRRPASSISVFCKTIRTESLAESATPGMSGSKITGRTSLAALRTASSGTSRTTRPCHFGLS
jgi:abortive infection bacteriophage resistance protein